MAKSNKLSNWSSKILGVIILGLITYLIVDSLAFKGPRFFYCLSDDKCVTVWKQLGNKCYIVPGKYYGLFKPSKTYIRTNNTQNLTLYFTNELPHKIILRNQGNSVSQNKYQIFNNSEGKWDIMKYSDSLKNILYMANALRFNEVKSNANYIDINIEENYAVDKTGEKLK